MSVTSHLKDLLTKMGGTPKNGDSTSVLIDKIEDVYNGSGSGANNSESISNCAVEIVTVYIDNLVDSDDDTGIYVIFKLNKTFKHIIDHYDAGFYVAYTFEKSKWSIMDEEQATAITAAKEVIVAHKNSSSYENLTAFPFGNGKMIIATDDFHSNNYVSNNYYAHYCYELSTSAVADVYVYEPTPEDIQAAGTDEVLDNQYEINLSYPESVFPDQLTFECKDPNDFPQWSFWVSKDILFPNENPTS